jgi:hypothetical protein
MQKLIVLLMFSLTSINAQAAKRLPAELTQYEDYSGVYDSLVMMHMRVNIQARSPCS